MSTLHEKYITDEKGNKNAIIIPIDEYNKLMEDIHDFAVIAERKNEAVISLDELKHKLD